MYNLAKLLTEEPQKIEKLLILFSKLILTFYLTSCIYGFNYSMSAILENPVPNDITTEKIIYFFVSLVIVWYACWNTIIGGILTLLPIWLIERKYTGKSVTDFFLAFFDIAHANSSGYTRGKNIIDFERGFRKPNSLDEFEEYDDRFTEYYALSLTTFLTLIFFSDIHLSFWTVWFFISLISGFFILSVLTQLSHKYLRANFESLRNEFKSLVYLQKVSNVVRESRFVKLNYEVFDLNSIIHMTSKNKLTSSYSEILIHVHYTTSSFLAGLKLTSLMQEYTEIDINSKRLYIVVSNQECDGKSLQPIIRNKQWVFIHSNKPLQILNNFEESMARLGVNGVV